MDAGRTGDGVRDGVEDGEVSTARLYTAHGARRRSHGIGRKTLYAAPVTPTLLSFTLLIARVGLTSFGGGLSAWMLRLVVHEKGWMTEAEFLSGLAVCQVFPGINVVNLAIWLGYRLLGTSGAVAGALAITVPPGLVMLALVVLTTGLTDNVAVRSGLDGVAAAAVGMGAAMGVRAGRRCLQAGPAIIMAAVFVAVGLVRLPLLPVMAVAVPLSVGLAWRDTA